MKRYFIVLAFLGALISCDDPTKSKGDNIPVAETNDTTTVQLIDSVYNFGSVTDGDKVEYNFRFKNTGNKPMVIGQPQASCGCTVAERPDKPVLPGDTSFIKVVFNSKGKIGHNEKTVTVKANTYPNFPPLLLRGEVTLKK